MTEQQTALVTGASRGLGHALALALAPRFHIIAVAKTTGALEALDDEIKARGGSATLAPMDVCNEGAMATLCRGIFDRWGKLDLWLHTAIHAAPLSPADHADLKDLAKSLETNVTATARLITYVAPLLGETGQAVFFDDPTAGQAFYGQYGATKAAQIALARSWAAENQRKGPRIDIVTPQAMPTGTRARFHPGEAREALSPPAAEAERLLTELGLA